MNKITVFELVLPYSLTVGEKLMLIFIEILLETAVKDYVEKTHSP